MAVNPQKKAELLDNPIERSNPVNEPGYQHEEGYNPFDLTQPKVLTARYGEATVVSSFDTVSGDRHLCTDDVMMFLDGIQDRVMNQMRTYIDYFNVPYRSIFPNNWDKIIVNPTKGDDVPYTALPAVPLCAFFSRFLDNPGLVNILTQYGDVEFSLENATLSFTTSYTADDIIDAHSTGFSGDGYEVLASVIVQNVALARLLYLCYVVSRGQLLDYLNLSFDDVKDASLDHGYKSYKSVFQEHVDNVFNRLLSIYSDGSVSPFRLAIYGVDLNDTSLTTTDYNLSTNDIGNSSWIKLKYEPTLQYNEFGEPLEPDFRLSSFRAALYECFEKGLYPYICGLVADGFSSKAGAIVPLGMDDELMSEYQYFYDYFGMFITKNDSIEDFDEFFDAGMINPSRIVAYQQAVAEYMTDDHVDNVFTSDLWMHNMRAIMFPSHDNVTSEPTFTYNGVDYEYDLFTTGAWNRAWFSNWSLENNFLGRSMAFISNVFVQRRSLRYKDYFVSARPNMLAVGDLIIPVNDGSVSPIDVTKGVAFQRFFNAVNRWKMKAKNYMASLFGVVPTDNSCKPAWIVRRVHGVSRDTTTNTAEDQGKVSTNLVTTSSDFAFDIFVDDFSVCIGMLTLDILPYYPAGIDRSYRHYDRFSLFNPMLQNIGDQEVRRDELTGDVILNPDLPFGYATRYAEYKQSVARAHGGFVNDIPARVFVYPMRSIYDTDFRGFAKISPDFIRDAPYYLDNFKEIQTGLSPAQYYHMVVSVNNMHHSARKIAMWPGIL